MPTFGNEQQVGLNPKKKHEMKNRSISICHQRVDGIICGKHVDWRALEKATHK